jgi:hypothetical protein
MVRQVAQEEVVVRMLPRLLLQAFLAKAIMVANRHLLLEAVVVVLEASAATLRGPRAVLAARPPQTVMTA